MGMAVSVSEIVLGSEEELGVLDIEAAVGAPMPGSNSAAALIGERQEPGELTASAKRGTGSPDTSHTSQDPLAAPPAQIEQADYQDWIRETARSMVGTVVSGKFQYELLEVLGVGGQAVVFRARQFDAAISRDVAIKFWVAAWNLLPKGDLGDRGRTVMRERLLARFAQEAQVLSQCNHRGLADVYEVGCLEQSPLAFAAPARSPWFAMQFVRGESLVKVLSGRGGRLPWREACDIGGQVADAIAAAHALGVFHLDLSPKNILVTHDGSVRVIDFGIALRREYAERQPEDRDRFFLGTVGYCSVEQLRCDRLDERADVYGLGAVLYKCIIGKPPAEPGLRWKELLQAGRWASTDEAALRRELPSGVQQLLLATMALDREDRVRSMREVKHAIEAIVAADGELPPDAIPSNVPVEPKPLVCTDWPPPPPLSWCRRYALHLYVAAVCVLVCSAFVATRAVLHRRHSSTGSANGGSAIGTSISSAQVAPRRIVPEPVSLLSMPSRIDTAGVVPSRRHRAHAASSHSSPSEARPTAVIEPDGLITIRAASSRAVEARPTAVIEPDGLITIRQAQDRAR